MSKRRREGETPAEHGRRVVRERLDAEARARYEAWEFTRKRDYQRTFIAGDRTSTSVDSARVERPQGSIN